MANYYVSTTGNNANAGTTEGAAWLTPAYALSKIVDGTIVEGDRIRILTGTYTLAAGLNFTKRFTAYVYFEAFGPGTPAVIDANGEAVVLHMQASYFWIDGITFQNAATTGIEMEACNYCKITRCIIQDTPIGIDGGSVDGSSNGHDNEIWGCLITDGAGDGFTCGSCHGWRIHNNEVSFRGISAGSLIVDGFAFHGSLDSMNYVYRNYIHDIEGKAAISTATLGGNAGSILTVFGNVIVSVTYAGILGVGAATAITAHNNIIVMDGRYSTAGGGILETASSNINAWANTIYNDSDRTDVPSLLTSSGGSLLNNISYARSTKAVHLDYQGTSAATSDNNLYYPDDTTADLALGRFIFSTVYMQFAAYKTASSQDAASVSSDPLLASTTYANPDSARITAGSPAINAGFDISVAGITMDFQGNSRPSGAWDIGAHHYWDGEARSVKPWLMSSGG